MRSVRILALLTGIWVSVATGGEPVSRVFMDNEPAYLFMSSGFNAKGDKRTTLHGFKFKRPLRTLMTSPSE